MLLLAYKSQAFEFNPWRCINKLRCGLRASVSRDVPVYSSSFRWVLIPAYPLWAGSGWV